jgi:N-acetylmuramoyl-L-alanine amidase-like protein
MPEKWNHYRPARPSSELIIADQRFKMPFPLVNFTEAPGFNATVRGCTVHGACGENGAPRQPAKGMERTLDRFRPRRYGEAKNRSVAWAQANIRQFVVHLDGLFQAWQCFDVLHNERGLSCHFILDNDGVWYQTLDLIDCGYHASGMNETSIGVEMCSRGEASGQIGLASAQGYQNMGIQRDIVTCNVHGEKYVAFDFTKEQKEAMVAMAKELQKLLPNIKLDYPKLPSGDPNWGLVYPDDAQNLRLRDAYSGYIGHYHANIQKWDPGPWDFKGFLGKLAGRFVFPVALHKLADKVEMPSDAGKLNAAAQAYYDNNEQEGAGGFFPVGPLEGYRLWHGGIHLHASDGDKVYVPFPGNVVAARQGAPTTNGSNNFVLIKHQQQIGSENIEFYTLYLHLRQEPPQSKKAQRLKWMMGEGWKNDDPGRVVALAPPQQVQAGEIIGHVGTAGPDGEPQLHFEIFAVDHAPVERIDKERFWTLVPGVTDRRFCTRAEIIGAIDKNKDKQLSHDELQTYFRDDPDRVRMHQMVTSHYSEWTFEPDWKQALREAGEYKKLKPAEIEELVDQQIVPMLWWDENLASKLKLPLDGRIYTYHPIGFLVFMNKLLVSTKATSSGIDKTTMAAALSYTHAGKAAKNDYEDTTGESFVNDEDRSVGKTLELEDLIEGYGD